MIGRPPRCFVIVIGLASAWSVASLTLPGTDLGAFAANPFGDRIGPTDELEAIVADRPTTMFDARRSGHPDTITSGEVSAGTSIRSALRRLTGDVRFPASVIARSRFAVEMVLRGPPSSFLT